jgi:hypothetical protein
VLHVQPISFSLIFSFSQIVRLTTGNFLYSPVISSLSDLRILLSTLFSNTLIICTALSARDEVSHLYKTRDKISVLYILIFTYLGNRTECKRLLTEV